MSQITLEVTNTLDLELLLSLVKRLDIKVVSLETANTNKRTEQINQLKAAVNDPLFLADVEMTGEDFNYSDIETVTEQGNSNEIIETLNLLRDKRALSALLRSIEERKQGKKAP